MNEDGKAAKAIDEAIRILSEDIGKKMANETPYSFNTEETLIL